MLNKYEQLEKLEQLRQQGILTQEEFEREKQRILNDNPPPKSNTMFSQPLEPTRSIYDRQQNGTYALLLHILLIIPYIGWFIVLIMWLAKKNESPLVRQHGAAIMNMTISTIIYLFGLFVFGNMLSAVIPSTPSRGHTSFNDANFIVLGLVILIVSIYGLITLIFIIINAVKASNGEAARYPLAIRMLNTDLPKEDLRTEDHLID
jgi:uncharacterized Tic20 family protein